MLKYKYFILITIVTVYFLIELIVGLYANSLTLQTDAFHMLSDLLALCIGVGALMMLDRERHHRYTYGWLRAEIIGGLINSVFLLSICFTLFIENIIKIIELANTTRNDQLESEISLVIGVAIGGLVVNLIGMTLFYNEHQHVHVHPVGEELVTHNHVQYAVLLHIIGDALGSILAIISGVLIKYIQSPWKFYVDPIASMLIIIFICTSSGKLLRDCIRILMHHWQGKPVDEITTEIQTIPGIQEIHDFHVWSLNGKFSIATLHVNLNEDYTSTMTDEILTEIKKILHQHGIHCSCIQPEWDRTRCIEPACEKDCQDLRCCKLSSDPV